MITYAWVWKLLLPSRRRFRHLFGFGERSYRFGKQCPGCHFPRGFRVYVLRLQPSPTKLAPAFDLRPMAILHTLQLHRRPFIATITTNLDGG